MKTRNAMQLKALINNKAKATGVSPQLMLQNYMLERLIDRISRSPRAARASTASRTAGTAPYPTTWQRSGRG